MGLGPTAGRRMMTNHEGPREGPRPELHQPGDRIEAKVRTRPWLGREEPFTPALFVMAWGGGPFHAVLCHGGGGVPDPQTDVARTAIGHTKLSLTSPPPSILLAMGIEGRVTLRPPLPPSNCLAGVPSLFHCGHLVDGPATGRSSRFRGGKKDRQKWMPEKSNTKKNLVRF